MKQEKVYDAKKRKFVKPKKAEKIEGYKIPENFGKVSKSLKYALKRLRKDGIALFGENAFAQEQLPLLKMIDGTIKVYPVTGAPSGITHVVTTEKYVNKAQDQFFGKITTKAARVKEMTEGARDVLAKALGEK